MTAASSKTDPGENGRKPNPRRLHLLIELLAVAALVGGIFWILQNHPPRGFVSQALFNGRLWIHVLLVSGLGTAASLISYYLGKRGTEAIFEHYPQLEGRPWERFEAIYQKLGAPTLVLSGIPGLGAAVLAEYSHPFEKVTHPFSLW